MQFLLFGRRFDSIFRASVPKVRNREQERKKKANDVIHSCLTNRLSPSYFILCTRWCSTYRFAFGHYAHCMGNITYIRYVKKRKVNSSETTSNNFVDENLVDENLDDKYTCITHTQARTRKQISLDRMVCFNDEHVCSDMESLANPKTNCSHSRFSKEEICSSIWICVRISTLCALNIFERNGDPIKRIQKEWVEKNPRLSTHSHSHRMRAKKHHKLKLNTNRL